MRHVFEAVVAFLTKFKDAIGAGAAAFGVVVAMAKIWPSCREAFRSWRDARSLRRRLGAEVYTREEIIRATRYYITPDCQDVDPGGSEDFRTVYSVRQNAFEALDKLLMNDTEHRHTILLADSGMGKTSLLMNYYARHQRSRSKRKRFAINLLPLGLPGIEERIEAVANKADTVLLLDAFDEDTKAISDHRERLGVLLKASHDFRHVLISCRTQFFLKEEEIPRETGLIRIGVTSANESHEYLFYKIYLSPFSDDQVEQYLHRRFGLLHPGQRHAAKSIAKKMRDLTARPMLLAHIPDLLGLQKPIEFSFELYEEMVKAWINREKPLVEDGEALREFSERMAVNIYTGRKSRSSERIAPEQLKPLAEKFGIRLPEWQLRGRSLLNRDAGGNLKFAHRSIMEYLFVSRFIAAPESVSRTEWTEQMKRFWWEIASSLRGKTATSDGRPGPPANSAALGWGSADLTDIGRLGLRPIYTHRARPRTMTTSDIVRESEDAAGREFGPTGPQLSPPHALEVVKFSPFLQFEDYKVLVDGTRLSAPSLARHGKREQFIFFEEQTRIVVDRGALKEALHRVRRVIRDRASGLVWAHLNFHTHVNAEEAIERATSMSPALLGVPGLLRLPTTIEVLALIGWSPHSGGAEFVRRIFRFPGTIVCCSDRDPLGAFYGIDWANGGPPFSAPDPSEEHLFVFASNYRMIVPDQLYAGPGNSDKE